MKKLISTVIVSAAAGAALFGTAGVASAETAWCKDAEFKLGCYTDGTPRVPGLNFWESQAYAESTDPDKTPEGFANPPSIFNLNGLFNLFSGSAGGSSDDEGTEPEEEETPAPPVTDEIVAE